MYKQSIILFGIVVPFIIAALVIGVCVLLKGKIETSAANKIQYYKETKQSRLGVMAMEAQLRRQREYSAAWDEMLKQETFSLADTYLRAITEKLPAKEFKQTSSDRLTQSSGLGTVSAQKSSGLKFAFRGTYRSVQRAFLELETRMPNLQLQELRIDPSSSGEHSLLDFKVTYTAWEK